jgi:hypothetical protein
MTKRNILLIEPKYRNKYPPIGLMKIATYHKRLGDNVIFFKGDLKDLLLNELTKKCVSKLKTINGTRDWQTFHKNVREYIRTKKSESIAGFEIDRARYSRLLMNCLNSFSDIYRKKQTKRYPKWDRVYVTTLFTFYWKVTVEAIQFAKDFVKDQQNIFVGGVLASLLHKELEIETGIKPHQGLLDKPGFLDPTNLKAQQLVVDDLPLDYSILDEIEYEYPTGSAYFTFMTKGCTRKCAFCSVPILEPIYKQKVETKDKFAEIKNLYGEQQHLLLMDNNVLASPKFPEIIQEIKEMGFYKGATYIEPNQLDIAVRNLKANVNNSAYARRVYKLCHELLSRLRGKTQQLFYDILVEHQLLRFNTVTRAGLLAAYPKLKDIYERHRNKIPKPRFVDFNQGTDARYVTDELMKLMSEIPIRPLRIAFDYWGMKDKYENAVRLAAKYSISELSNYILYNFKDRPEELYKRLEINVLLNEELGISIYSFPMKYIPLFGEEAKDRTHIGPKWNKKYIRAIQSILNVTKGIVAPGRGFFAKAFGVNIEEFKEILYMPETYIVYRYYFEGIGLTNQWRSIFRSLTDQERNAVFPIIESNNFSNFRESITDDKLITLLEHYTIKRENDKVKIEDGVLRRMKRDFDRLIRDDKFIDLTLTYDFEADTIKPQSYEFLPKE